MKEVRVLMFLVLFAVFIVIALLILFVFFGSMPEFFGS
jgi:hypothetical protein